MHLVRGAAALLVVATLEAAAFAHGGEYVGPPTPPPPVPPHGPPMPSGPAVPPGTADPPVTVTRWETWWAANKEFYLRLNVQMREDDGPQSEGLAGKKTPKSAAETAAQRAAREAEVREALVPVFVEALTDPSFEVRTSAAIALGKSGSAGGTKPLREAAVNDRHKDVRDSAVLGLGLCGQASEIPFLDAVLCDEKQNNRHRSFAAFALGLIGGEDAGAALLAFADGKGGRTATFVNEAPEVIASTFVAMGLTGDAHVLPVLRKALANPRFDETVRAFVVLSLGRMKDRESLGDVGRILVVEKDPGLRRSAAVALGRMATAADDAAATGLLAALTGDPDEIVRHFCAISLGGFGDAAVCAKVEKLFGDAKSQQRPFLALALALGHDAAAAPMLREALGKETNESVKASYCIALALLGDQEAAPLLEKAAADRGLVWLQGYAALGLGILHHFDSAPLLVTRLEAESDSRLKANLAVALGLMHDPVAKTYLVKTLRAEGTIYERGGAAMAMGVLRMNESVTDLVDVWRDRKEQDLVRAFSVVALGLIADPSPVPKLARFAIDNNYSLSVDPLNEVLSIF